MTNRWRDRFSFWLISRLANLLPESIRRQVLYDLQERVFKLKPETLDDGGWAITFEEIYQTLKD